MSSGGLVSALSGTKKQMEFTWIGWPGESTLFHAAVLCCYVAACAWHVQDDDEQATGRYSSMALRQWHNG